MASCPSLEKCPFFNDKLAQMPSLAELYKQQYCRGNYVTCARYQVSKAIGSERVPESLYPPQVHRVEALLRAASDDGAGTNG